MKKDFQAALGAVHHEKDKNGDLADFVKIRQIASSGPKANQYRPNDTQFRRVWSSPVCPVKLPLRLRAGGPSCGPCLWLSTGNQLTPPLKTSESSKSITNHLEDRIRSTHHNPWRSCGRLLSHRTDSTRWRRDHGGRTSKEGWKAESGSLIGRRLPERCGQVCWLS